jgi:hypothetical protein
MENKHIEYALRYFNDYAVKIASFMLDFDSDEYEFNVSMEEPGVSKIEAYTKNEEDRFSVVTDFRIVEDFIKELGEECYNNCSEYLLQKAISDNQVNSNTTKEYFICLMINNIAMKFANECKNLNFEL